MLCTNFSNIYSFTFTNKKLYAVVMSVRASEPPVHVAETDASDTADSTDSADDRLPVSVDLIDDRLYLGNLTAACDSHTLRRLGVSHVLTVDSVPLPRAMLDSSHTVDRLTLRYIKLADVAKEDLISHLPETNEFIRSALESGGTVLVHCYFGVSRSAAVVIAHMMATYDLSYDDAFQLVKAKRRFIGPNAGFIAQLKLFGSMGCRIDRDNPRFKQFRLKMAGQKLKEVKILPQLFAELVRPDPGLARERPEPLVYRCRRCRRVVAHQGNIIPHVPHEMKLELARKRAGPTSSEAADSASVSADQLAERLRAVCPRTPPADIADTPGGEVLVDAHHEYEGVLVDEGVVGAGGGADAGACRRVLFVEPLSWMRGVRTSAQGKLHCPQCAAKIGSFSWVMGCKCPCGKKVAPAFYLVPSKVEPSNVVQNVQVTV